VTTGAEVFDLLQRRARSAAARAGTPAPTSEYLLRHLLESFLDRLTKTEHADSFVLKGGVLLAAYGVRRSTKDIDAAAISVAVTPDHLRQVVHDIAAAATDDGVRFDVDAITVREIRDEAEYPGLRLRVPATVGPWKGVTAWDVSTGDPIIPAPQLVTLPRVLGGVVEIIGYRPETTIAEKGVTILERSTTSTRWRDYIDIVQLFEHYEIDRSELLAAARAVAAHRSVELGPVAPHIIGYGTIAQAKWTAWRRKEHLEDICEPNLDDQLARTAAHLDPVFGLGQE
jgi:hypothetical protein